MKKTWYSEKELGDLFWADPEAAFEASNSPGRWFREFEINRGRVDFLKTTGILEKSRPNFDLYEFKITADTSAVMQILRYKRELEEYIRSEMNMFPAGRIPTVSINLAARFFDSKIIDACVDLGIFMWEIEIDDDQNIALVEKDFDYFPRVNRSEKISEVLMKMVQ